MSDEHAKINRLDLLTLALTGVNSQIDNLGYQRLAILREIDTLKHPLRGPTYEKRLQTAILDAAEVAHKPVQKRKPFSEATKKKMAASQLKRCAAARKEKKHA